VLPNADNERLTSEEAERFSGEARRPEASGDDDESPHWTLRGACEVVKSTPRKLHGLSLSSKRGRGGYLGGRKGGSTRQRATYATPEVSVSTPQTRLSRMRMISWPRSTWTRPKYTPFGAKTS